MGMTAEHAALLRRGAYSVHRAATCLFARSEKLAKVQPSFIVRVRHEVIVGTKSSLAPCGLRKPDRPLTVGSGWHATRVGQGCHRRRLAGEGFLTVQCGHGRFGPALVVGPPPVWICHDPLAHGAGGGTSANAGCGRRPEHLVRDLLVAPVCLSPAQRQVGFWEFVAH